MVFLRALWLAARLKRQLVMPGHIMNVPLAEILDIHFIDAYLNSSADSLPLVCLVLLTLITAHLPCTYQAEAMPWQRRWVAGRCSTCGRLLRN